MVSQTVSSLFHHLINAFFQTASGCLNTSCMFLFFQTGSGSLAISAMPASHFARTSQALWSSQPCLHHIFTHVSGSFITFSHFAHTSQALWSSQPRLQPFDQSATTADKPPPKKRPRLGNWGVGKSGSFPIKVPSMKSTKN